MKFVVLYSILPPQDNPLEKRFQTYEKIRTGAKTKQAHYVRKSSIAGQSFEKEIDEYPMKLVVWIVRF